MVIKSSVSILLLLLFVKAAGAQQPVTPPAPVQKLSFFSVTIGSSIPSGDYALTDLNSKYAGFATTGFNFALNLNAIFRESNAGIALMYSSFSNPVNNPVLKAQYEKEFPGTTWSVQTTDWKCSSFMAGICVSYPLGDWSFGLRILLGLTNARSPQINTQISGNTSPGILEIHQDSDSESSFSLDGGVNLCYHLSKDITLIAGADYFTANPKFRLLAFGGGYAAAGETDQPIRLINATGGLALLF